MEIMMPRRLPPWFKQKLADPKIMSNMHGLLGGLRLHTICQNAICPNIGQCFSSGTATFLILGDVCTRRCTFCAVQKSSPAPIDEEEPQHLLAAAEKLNLSYIVITSVTRDDLPDGGASHFAGVVRLLHERKPDAVVEVLIPDLSGSTEALRAVVASYPEVINHNIETVPRLYPEVRPGADYSRSLELLYTVKKLNRDIVTKSGLMLGLGESQDEVMEVMRDLREAECDLLTIGQYLSPSPRHHPVVNFVTPEEFQRYEDIGREMGFARVASAPLVRSSYKAAELYAQARGHVEKSVV
jgi:lipoic acid synthetase